MIMPQEQRSIESLCEAISRNTQTVAEYLRENRLSFPSFDVDAPSDSRIAPGEVKIQQARMNVINDTLSLRSLMLGPRDFLQTFLVSQYLYHFGLLLLKFPR